MRRRVTCETTTFEAMVDPNAAACSVRFLPQESVILSDDEIEEILARDPPQAKAMDRPQISNNNS